MNAPPSPTKSLRILHIEDDPLDAELTAALIREEWADSNIRRVDSAESVRQSLAEGDWDLILSDYSLPGFGGLTALGMVRESIPAVPFIFLSGTIGEDRAVEALKRGATDYVIKDRPARLIPAIHQAIALVEEARRRRTAESTLRETRELLEQLAEKSTEVFWFAAYPPIRIQYVSPAVETVWQRPASAFYEDRGYWEESLHAMDRDRVLAAQAAFLARESPTFEEEYRIVRPDGSLCWVRDRRTVIGEREDGGIQISGITADITARRVQEERIREQSELIDKAREAIIVCNLQSRIRGWNSGAERLFGWRADEVMGLSASSLFRQYEAELFRAIGRAMKEGEWRGELELVNREGRLLLVDCGITVIHDTGGTAKSLLIIASDITERRAIEKQLLRTQRLESIGTLAGGIAHDLNNVLNPILMATELLQRRDPRPDAQRLLRIIQKSTWHGSALVGQVLAFSRGAEGLRSPIKPSIVINDVVELLNETLPLSIRIRKKIERSPEFILINPTELGQVLMNLCVNARDAMPEGGEITIAAKVVVIEGDGAGIGAKVAPGRYIRIEVADTGTGIPPEIIDRIFDPFFTTKEIGKGTGLGLSTSLGIVRSQGGFLFVDSAVGEGTTFRIYLPTVTEDEPAATDSALGSGEVTTPGRGERILVIDDEKRMRIVASMMLEEAGYTVSVAAGGVEGLQMFDSADGFDLVLIDMMMPGMQGVEVMEKLRERQPDLPVILMSGYPDPSRDPTQWPPRTRFLEKPMTSEELLSVIVQLLRVK